MNDAHSRVIYPESKTTSKKLIPKKSWKTPAFSTMRIDNRLYIINILDSTKVSNKIIVGCEIVKINNQTIKSLVQEKLLHQQFSYANLNYYLTTIYPTFLRGYDKFKVITLINNGITCVDTIQLYPYNEINWLKTNQSSYTRIDSNIVLYNPAVKDDSAFWNFIRNSNYQNLDFIVDLRRYPQRFTSKDSIFKYFYPKDSCYAVFKSVNNPGRFTYKQAKFNSSTQTNFKDTKQIVYSGNIALLVNSNTMSRGEYFVMIYQGIGSNVMTIGSQTAGTDGDFVRLSLVEGIGISFSGIGVYYPDMIETQGKGIRINLEVLQSVEGIRQQKDDLLEKAIEILKSK